MLDPAANPDVNWDGLPPVPPPAYAGSSGSRTESALESALEIVSLTVSYRVGASLDQPYRALEPLSLRLPWGQLVGIIGPNGAGKSTLIKAILGLVPCQSGQVLLAGRPLKSQRQRVAYVPQRSQIDWHYPITVQTAVMTGQTVRLGWGRSPDRAARNRARQAMERLGLWELRRQPLGTLSGGQQQRVFLARALTQGADVFLLDEPLAGVDRHTELTLQALWQDLAAAGKLVLVCSHQWGQALEHYDRLLLLNRRLLADDHPAVVMASASLRQAYGELVEPNDASPPKESLFC